MKPLYIFRHIDCEGPGYLAEVLDRQAIPWQLIAIDADAAVPNSIDGCSGLVFMGGPMSVNDDLPWIGRELDLIRAAHTADLPVLGHCLGGQLLSKALGGAITANPVKEIGWHPVRQSDTTTAEKWLAGLPGEMTLFHWHGETFSIPEGAGVILENDTCAHQGFAIGNTLALQCHVEMQASMVHEWAALYADEIAQPSATIQSAGDMTRGLEMRIRAAQAVANSLYERWLALLTD
ncbi:MAG: type 1 glutamine amidotransferase [Gammaproteobacteria bacterium]